MAVQRRGLPKQYKRLGSPNAEQPNEWPLWQGRVAGPLRQALICVASGTQTAEGNHGHAVAATVAIAGADDHRQ